MKRLSILGSTGSIGTQTLDVVRHHPDLQVTALAAGKNVSKLEEQIREFRPRLAALADEADARDLRARVKDLDVTVVSGMDGLIEAASFKDADMTVTAIVGMIGIQPTIAAIRAGKDIALANKETLVTAGHLIMPLARECGVKILPVDSEHSAIFQSLNGENYDRIEKLLLTCSGGPFRGRSLDDLEAVTVEDALKHPNWSMGPKITVDSATLVNKGLEVMEAGWLFGVDCDRIEVVVQPQSVIHSAVQFVDGAVIAQMGTPDMRLPIQYALFWPDRRGMDTERLDLFALRHLTFERPDTSVFRGLPLAVRAMKEGGSMPTVFNAANEKAVRKFLKGEIAFMDIYRIIESCMDAHTVLPDPDVPAILEVEKEVYAEIDRL
jgi:1-deoxy-D-xylulose-5-phosphate reductoisomerase